MGGYFEKMAKSVSCQPCMGKSFVLEKDNVEAFPKNAVCEIAVMSIGYAFHDKIFTAENALFPFFI